MVLGFVFIVFYLTIRGIEEAMYPNGISMSCSLQLGSCSSFHSRRLGVFISSKSGETPLIGEVLPYLSYPGVLRFGAS
jgi:hypothetical protein